jgi:1-phosphofructokinase
MTTRNHPPFDVATVTLNPAIDRTISVSGLATGAVNRALHVGDRPGGKGVNVAAALAARGHRTAALGFLGRDNGSIFTRSFAKLGVHDAFIRLPGETRTGLKIVDPLRGETTDLNFPGLMPSPADVDALMQQLDTLETRWCVLAGSLPPGVPASFYAECVGRLKARGILVAIDTSGEALREAASASPDMIKPNIHELSALTGRELTDEASILAAARALIRTGIRLVAVSRGADGACFVTGTEVIHARPPSIAVHSTVGAGDAMVAGIVAAQLRDLPLDETARLATAYSLQALSGDNPSIEAHASLEGFAARVELRREPAPGP